MKLSLNNGYHWQYSPRLASLFYIFFIVTSLGASSRTDHSDGGYFWVVIIAQLLFAIAMFIVTSLIVVKGNFDWVKQRPETPHFLIFIGLLSILITIVMTALFRIEPQPPFSVKYLTTTAPFLFPLVLIGAGVILINDSLKISVPVVAYRIPLMVVLGVSIVSNAVGLIEILIAQKQTEERRGAVMRATAGERLSSSARVTNANHQGEFTLFTPANQVSKMPTNLTKTVKLL